MAAVTGTLLASSIGSKPPGSALTMVVVELLQRWLGFRLLPAFGAGLIPFLLPAKPVAGCPSARPPGS